MKKFLTIFTQKNIGTKLLVVFFLAVIAFSPLAAQTAHASTPTCNPASAISWSSHFSITQCIAEGANLVLTLVAWILWASGILLNLTVKYTVIDMAATIRGITAIDIGWRVFRDLANMFFIFALLYIAIATIFSASTHSMRQSLVWLILAALLINFSLFFTKVVIDASNVVAAEFYNNITVNGQRLGEQNLVAGGAGSFDAGLSDAFMQPLRLQSLYNPQNGSLDATAASNFTRALADASRSVLVMIFGSVFLFIAAVVFIMAAGLFIVRFVVLVFLMILSPFAVAGWILPRFNSLTNQWMSALTNQAIFAPLYMMLTWIVLKIVTAPNFLGNDSNSDFAALLTSGALTGTEAGQAGVGILLNFVVIIAFLIGTIVLSKSYATQGVPFANQFLGKMTAAAGGALFGSGARLGRRTIGKWYGTDILENDDRRRDLQQRAARGDRFARLQLWSANKAATASFDARNAGVMGLAAGAVGADLGKAQTGGRKAALEAKKKAYTDWAKQAYGEDRELTNEKLQAQVARVKKARDDAEAVWKAAPAATPAKADARRALADANNKYNALKPLENDLNANKSPQQFLKEAQDNEKKALEAYEKAADDAARKQARNDLDAARNRQQDLFGDRLQKRYGEHLEELGKKGTVLGIMSTRRAAQKGAGKDIGKETAAEKMKDVDTALERAREERRTVTEEIAEIRGKIRDRGRGAVATPTEQTDLDTLTARSADLRKVIDEMNQAKKYKIKDPYTFLTNLRTQYPNMP